MANDKNKEAPAFGTNHVEEIIFLLAGLFVLAALMSRAGYFLGLLDAAGLLGWWQALTDFLIRFWPIWKVAVLFLVGASIVWAIYNYMKLQQVESEDEKIYGITPDDTFLDTNTTLAEKENERWVRILEHANSNNPADWRLAIIEADVMLEELLRISSYHGDSIGEMLKAVDKSDMLTLDNAWEAHKIRNQIAHAGGEFQLDERETKRVIALFESVFREFGMI
ncbi:MAG: hypothetical protein HYT69_02795 [Candidatus Zambryskibacteria bacterium]|nr:hypothetical protein [Candidatus Zambryskibacteria bacterium]